MTQIKNSETLRFLWESSQPASMHLLRHPCCKHLDANGTIPDPHG